MFRPAVKVGTNGAIGCAAKGDPHPKYRRLHSRYNNAGSVQRSRGVSSLTGSLPRTAQLGRTARLGHTVRLGGINAPDAIQWSELQKHVRMPVAGKVTIAQLTWKCGVRRLSQFSRAGTTIPADNSDADSRT